MDLKQKPDYASKTLVYTYNFFYNLTPLNNQLKSIDNKKVKITVKSFGKLTEVFQDLFGW